VGTFLVVPSCHLVACILPVVASSIAAAGTSGSIPKIAGSRTVATAVHRTAAAATGRRQDLDRNRLG